MSTSKPWADAPFSLLPTPGTHGANTCSNADALSVAVEMASVHNAFIRGLNSIYVQAPHIAQPADIKDFMLYISAWGDSLHLHHSHEETIFFPQVELLAQKAGLAGIMDTNVDQHHQFEQKLQETIKYVAEVRNGTKKYSGVELLALIDGFAPILTQHLHDEVESLLRLEKCDGKKLRKAMAEVGQEALKSADSYLMLPLVLGCIDKTYAGAENFPPVPFFVPYLNAYWFSRKYRGIWRFNPCDHWGKPRPLQFL